MKIGIALGGGGAKGFAHIGVLTALAEAGVEPDVVAGTSMGALVGAVYASGNIQRLKEASTRIRLKDIPMLLGPTWPKQGLFSGRRIVRLLDELIGVKNIEDLEKTFAAVCVDLRGGEVFTFTKGDIRHAIRASIAIPAVFTPVSFEGKLLVDGGVLEPVPVHAARSLGADFVIAVDLLAKSGFHGIEAEINRLLREEHESSGGSPILDSLLSFCERFSPTRRSNSRGGREYELNIIGIIQRISLVTQRELTRYLLKEYTPNFVIRPAVSQIGMFDLHRGRVTVRIGEEAVRAVLPMLIEEINKSKTADK